MSQIRTPTNLKSEENKNTLLFGYLHNSVFDMLSKNWTGVGVNCIECNFRIDKCVITDNTIYDIIWYFIEYLRFSLSSKISSRFAHTFSKRWVVQVPTRYLFRFINFCLNIYLRNKMYFNPFCASILYPFNVPFPSGECVKLKLANGHSKKCSVIPFNWQQ